MLKWLVVLLLVCAVVHGKELECDEIKNETLCYNSVTHKFNFCWICDVRNQIITNNDEVLFIKFAKESVDVKFVSFMFGEVTKMPKLIHKTKHQQLVQVKLWSTHTQVLNAEFFENAAENLTTFESIGNKLTVEAFTFQNFKNLEHLRLSYGEIKTIPSDTFRGLHKLSSLDLSWTQLALINENWFYDLDNLEVLNLSSNILEEIPDKAFESLTRLKELFLSRNNIEIITKNIFRNNEQLQRIYLQINRISQIQSGSFAHLSQLTFLYLSDNRCVNNKFINNTLNEIAEGLTACYPSTCVIPQILNGIIVSIDDNSTKLSGELFEGSGSVKVVCNFTFTQIHDKANQTTNRCMKKDWEDQQWPTCQSELFSFSSLIS